MTERSYGKLPNALHRDEFSTKDDLSSRPNLFQVSADVHPPDQAARLTDDEHDRICVLLPILHMPAILDREDFGPVSAPLDEV